MIILPKIILLNWYLSGICKCQHCGDCSGNVDCLFFGRKRGRVYFSYSKVMMYWQGTEIDPRICKISKNLF